MLRLALAIGLVLSVAACAPTVYNHPSKTQADYNRDMYDCDQLASAKTRNDGFGNNPIITGDNIRDCMVRKYGYSIGAQQQRVAAGDSTLITCKRQDGIVIKTVRSYCTDINGTLLP